MASHISYPRKILSKIPSMSPRLHLCTRNSSRRLSFPYRPHLQRCPLASRGAFVRMTRIQCRRYDPGGEDFPKGHYSNRIVEHERYNQGMFWNVLEGITLVGGVGGAVAVALGADLVLVSLPIVLPLLSLAVGRRRERVRVERLQQLEDQVQQELGYQTKLLAESSEGLAVINDAVTVNLEKRIKTVEQKTAAMEGTVLTTAQNVQRVVTGLKSLPGMVRQITDMQQQAILYSINNDLRSRLEGWGNANLKGLESLSGRIRYLEDSMRRLELTGAPQPSQYGTNAYEQPVIPITVEAEPTSENAPFLKLAKETLFRELSGVLEDVQLSQVDIVQSLKDLSFQQSSGSNMVPEISDLESRMTDLGTQLVNLPGKMAEGLRKELEELNTYKGDMALQLSSVTATLETLERTVLEMKEEARLKGPSTEIVFGEDQVDSGKIALQYVELQKNFSGLLEELATLRSSFEEFRAVSAETKAHVSQSIEAQDLATQPPGIPKDMDNNSEIDKQGTSKLNDALPAVTSQESTDLGATDDMSTPSPTSGMAPIEESQTSNDIQTTLEPSSTPQELDLPLQSSESISSETSMRQEETFSRPQEGFRKSMVDSPSTPSAPPVSSMPNYEDFLNSQPTFNQQGFTPLNENFGNPNDDFVPTWMTVLEPNTNPYGDPEAFRPPVSSSDRMNTQGNFGTPSDDFSRNIPQPPTQGRPSNETDWYQRDVLGNSGNPYSQPAVNPIDPTPAGMSLEFMQESEPDTSIPAEANDGFYQEGMVQTTATGNVQPEMKLQGDVSGERNTTDDRSMNKGLQLLKEGRKAVMKDFGEAYRLLGAALDCFELHLEGDKTDIKALGNCGNTLLALGELKVRMADSVSEVQVRDVGRNTQAQQQLREEAQQLFTLAGQKFKSLLEASPSDERGYMNWAKALSFRAKLVVDLDLQEKLFHAASAKYEQVLRMRPRFAPAVLAYAGLLKDWATRKPERDLDGERMMQKAISYLQDIEVNSAEQSISREAASLRQQYERMTQGMRQAFR